MNRFDVFFVALDPTLGSEIREKPALPDRFPDEANRRLATVIVAPMTTKGQATRLALPAHSRGKPAKSCSTNCGPWTKPAW